MLEIMGQIAVGMALTPDFYIKKNGYNCSKRRERKPPGKFIIFPVTERGGGG